MKEQNEKQAIEETAALMDGACDVIPLGECYTVDCNKCKAALLYNAGYRKQIVGEWIDANPNGHLYRFTCSLCGKTKLGKGTPFCPHCGARMKG
jgi:hypothetical protein